MITILFGKPRVGKTLLMTYFLILEMFNKDRIYKMRKEITEMNANGFNYSIPKHPLDTLETNSDTHKQYLKGIN